MPADTTIPCSFQARDAVKSVKPESKSYSEFLTEMFAHEHEYESSPERETEGY